MRIILFIIPCMFYFISCKTKSNIEKERQTILSMLQTERKAHFERNADLFVSEFADSMVSINKGKVSKLSIDQNKKRIEPYFNSVRFIKWDDMFEPIINFSDDGSLAYAIVQKEVIISYPDSTGKTIIDTTYYAWSSIYRKQKDNWKIECNISTNK